MKKKDLNLSTRQQLLLSRYVDHECGVIDRIRAQRLLSSHPAAHSFIRSIRLTADSYRDCVGEANPAVDLWARIDARIEQETKAALYLGSRREEAVRLSLFERLTSAPAMIGGASGAVMAVMALIAIYQPQQIVSFSSPTAPIQAGSGVFHPVALEEPGRTTQPHRFIARRSNPALEVDWMRANGSLALIPDANGTSAIIWVRRHGVTARSPRVAPSLQAANRNRAVPSPHATTAEQWLDERSGSGAK